MSLIITSVYYVFIEAIEEEIFFHMRTINSLNKTLANTKGYWAAGLKTGASIITIEGIPEKEQQTRNKQVEEASPPHLALA